MKPLYNAVTARIAAAQVKLRTNKRFQLLVAGVTIFAVFADILGTAVIMPGLASVCTFAEGGPGDLLNQELAAGLIDQETYDAQVKKYISPHAFKGDEGAWDGAPPVKFSLSMNLVVSSGYFASAAGSLWFGYLCDKIGCKIPMQTCLAMGIGGYIIIYASAIWVKSYYLFMIGNAWNNFFGVCMQIASTYFGQLFEGAERDNYNSMVLGMGLIGGTVGAFIVMPFSNNPSNGENYFEAIWLAIGVTAVALLGVTFILVPPQEKDPNDKPDPATLVTPPMAARLLWITVVASALDSGGDEGTRMARGTVLTAVFPEWQTAERQNYLLMGLLVMVIMSLALLTWLRQVINLPACATIGCLFTLATQVVLIAELDVGPFLAVWYSGKLFGFLSTLASGLIITELSPKALLGHWNGINEGCTNIAMAVAPLIFSTVYDEVGNVRGQEMLACTAAVSAASVLAYSPLIGLMPKKIKDKPEELKELSYYEEMSDADFKDLPYQTYDKVMTMMIEAGKKPRQIVWGTYEEDRPKLPELQSRMAKDFEYFSQQLVRMLSNREVLIKEQKDLAALDDMGVPRDEAKHDMGAWLADYFDDAGYIGWEAQAPFFKAMIMAAFPPIDPLDNVRPQYHTMPVEKFEELMTKVLQVMDSHLASEQRRIRSLNQGVFGTIIRRR